MTGHKLVRFSREERERLRAFVEHGGLLFSDDCNHDVNGLYARSFEQEMRTIFAAAGAMPKLPARHPIYRSFFTFDDGPPTTSHELNGWGDEIVHDYLRAVDAPRAGRRALQQQGLRLRVGLRLAQQALPARGQHEVRGQHRGLRDDELVGNRQSEIGNRQSESAIGESTISDFRSPISDLRLPIR